MAGFILNIQAPYGSALIFSGALSSSLLAAVTVPATAQSNKSIYVIFRATDNVAVRSVNATLDGNPVSFTSLAGVTSLCKGTSGPMPPDTYGFAIPIAGSPQYIVSVRAVDTSDLVATSSITIVAS